MFSTLRNAFLFTCAIGSTAPLVADQVRIHDPVIARENGVYYLYGTGHGIPFYSSEDLVHWKRRGRIFEEPPSWAEDVAPGNNGSLWAPDVIQRGDDVYLYFSVSVGGKITSAIGVTSGMTLDPESPDYAWSVPRKVIQSVPNRDLFNAIDPNIIVDDSDTAWMNFGSFWSGLKLVKLNESWTAPADPPVWHALAKRERSVLVDDEEPEPAAIEAPFIFKKNDEYYLFLSWDYCCRGADSTYKIVVGRADDFRGPYLDRDGKSLLKGGGTVILEGTPDWPGTGHCSVYTFDDTDYLVFHAYEAADDGRSKLKIAEIEWDTDGWPVVDPEILDTYQSVLVENH